MTKKKALEVLKSWSQLAYHNADGTDESSAELYEALQTVFDVITRQQAELEQLKKRIKSYEQFDEFKARIRVDDMIVCADSLSEWLYFCDKLKSEAVKEFVERTVDYLIASGVILPPCKVGDTVYLPNMTDWGTFECYEITEFVFDGKELYFVVDDEDRETHPIEEIGETVFLTRDEAEKAIERSNPNDRNGI